MAPDGDRPRDHTSRRTPAEPGSKRAKEHGTSPWEWFVASLSGILVAATVAYLIYEAVGTPDTPPLIEVRPGSVIESPGGYIVQLELHNRGRTTAAGITIQGTLLHGDSTLQTSTTTLDYLPARSTREAALIFSLDPRRYRLILRPTGYITP